MKILTIGLLFCVSAIAQEVKQVSSLPFESEKNGFGPAERNLSNGEERAKDGQRLSINGRGFDSGIGVHANSEIVIKLNNDCHTFSSFVGIDDESGNQGSVRFRVVVDGKEAHTSGVIRGQNPAQFIQVNTRNAKTLKLIVDNGGDNYNNDHADWADAKLTCGEATSGGGVSTDHIYVSDLSFASEKNGWGPVERNKSNGETAAGDGRTISIGGKSFEKGLGAHSNSEVIINIGGVYTNFLAEVGVDDESGDNGSVQFELIGDGRSLYKSRVLKGTDGFENVNVAIAQVQQLKLVVNNGGDNHGFDHASWGNARLTKTNTSSTPAPVASPPPISGDPSMSVVQQVLSTYCYQFGFDATVLQEKQNYYKTRKLQNISDIKISDEIRLSLKDQTKCFFGKTALQLVKHVTVFKTQYPDQYGATFMNRNHLIKPEADAKYYQVEGATGALEVARQGGNRTNRMGVSIEGWDSESVPYVLDLIKRSRLAGFEDVWLVYYLRKDCCETRKVPPAIKGGVNAPIVAETIYKNIEKWAFEATSRFVKESELPITNIVLGNELDGGWWTDFDASEDYSGPPARMDLTKKVALAAKKGIARAYASVGLQNPFIQFQVMPNIDRGTQANIDFVRSFLSLDSVSEPIWNNVSFSFYPSSRGMLNPIETAQQLKDLGESSGFPWTLSELGFAIEKAPGNNGWAWNHFVDVKYCPSIFGRGCSDLEDRQALELEKTFDVFKQSASFAGGIYLAPQGNIVTNSENNDSPPMDMYRLALFKTDFNVDVNGNGPKAQPAKAFYKWREVINSSFNLRIDDVGSFCKSTSDCFVWFWGKNLKPNSVIEIRSNSGELLTRLFSSDFNRETPSVLTFTLSGTLASRFTSEGLKFGVTLLDNLAPQRRSNVFSKKGSL